MKPQSHTEHNDRERSIRHLNRIVRHVTRMTDDERTRLFSILKLIYPEAFSPASSQGSGLKGGLPNQ